MIPDPHSRMYYRLLKSDGTDNMTGAFWKVVNHAVTHETLDDVLSNAFQGSYCFDSIVVELLRYEENS